MKLLHIGCGNIKHDGFTNTDKSEMDIRKPWPHKDETVDGIVAMQVFQCLTWSELMFAFSEAHRVLRVGGAMRIGVNLVENNYPLDKILYGANINLFSYDLLKNILRDRVGFSAIAEMNYRDSWMKELAVADNRHNRGSSYIEVIK